MVLWKKGKGTNRTERYHKQHFRIKNETAELIPIDDEYSEPVDIQTDFNISKKLVRQKAL